MRQTNFGNLDNHRRRSISRRYSRYADVDIVDDDLVFYDASSGVSVLVKHLNDVDGGRFLALVPCSKTRFTSDLEGEVRSRLSHRKRAVEVW